MNGKNCRRNELLENLPCLHTWSFVVIATDSTGSSEKYVTERWSTPSMIIQQKGNIPIFRYTILRNFKKNFSIYVDVQMVNSVNNDEYRNTYHIAHDNRTANTRKCLGIAAFGWWITENNAFYLRKQLKNASKHFISLRWPTRECWKTVVFKRFLRIFCPRKWKETLYLRRKTSFKAIFYYWKTPVSNEYKQFFHLTPPS